MEEVKRHSNDHDLLITVSTKLDSVMGTVKELKDNVINRVARLEDGKANDCDIESIKKERIEKWKDLDARLDSLENWRSTIIGILSVMGILAGLISYIYFIRYDIMRERIDEVKQLIQKHMQDN